MQTRIIVSIGSWQSKQSRLGQLQYPPQSPWIRHYARHNISVGEYIGSQILIDPRVGDHHLFENHRTGRNIPMVAGYFCEKFEKHQNIPTKDSCNHTERKQPIRAFVYPIIAQRLIASHVSVDESTLQGKATLAARIVR